MIKRMTRWAASAACILASLTTTVAQAQPVPASAAIVLPSDADIRQILAERIAAVAGREDGVCIVVGLIGPQGRRVIAFGHPRRHAPRPADGDTVFEIGSVTKVFTALLLADMVRTGQVALAERNGRSITLVDLATHTSGLPFMPDEPIVLGDSAAKKYGTRQLAQFLSRYELSREIGAGWDYSNIGYWLLGESLASRAGTNFESLLETRICRPLQLKSTACTVSPSLQARLAVGHDASLQPAPLFSATSVYAAMPAAGGLVSTVNDLLHVLAVAMGYEHSALTSSLAAMLTTRRPLGENEQALGWVVQGKGDEQLILHDGFTWGYASYVAWDPMRRVGVVVLSNQIHNVGDIAQHLLRPKVTLDKPSVTKHTEITLAASALDTYAGRFAAEGEGVFNITRAGDFLTLQLPLGWGLPTFRLRPESRRDFFIAELPLRVTFQPDSSGRINELLVYPPRGQHAIAVKRIH